MDGLAYIKKRNEEARKRGIPYGGILELTPRCTFDCKMCYVHLTNEQMNGRKELSTEKWIEVLDTAYEMGLTFILLTGGECLLHKGFREIYLHAKSLGLITSVNTNGKTLTDEHIELFRRYPPRQLHFTLYGKDEDTYEKVTGHRAYQTVVDNIRKAKAAGIHVVLAITPCKYLIEEIPDLIAFAKKEGLSYTVNPALMKANDDTGRSMDDYGLTIEESVRVEELRYKAEGLQIIPRQELITELPKHDYKGEVVRGLPCQAGRAGFTLAWDGKLHPCDWVSNISVSILDKGFVQAWEEVKALTKQYIYPVECLDCKYAYACRACTSGKADPNNPGHCNPEVCRETIAFLNAGMHYIKKNNKSELESDNPC